MELDSQHPGTNTYRREMYTKGYKYVCKIKDCKQAGY